jgi:glycosyltransferase 2 family protein
LDTFFTSFLLLRGQRTRWPLMALTAVSTALDAGRVVAVFMAMGIGLSIPVVVFAYLAAAMLGMALLIPGGVGVTEVSMAGLIAVLAPGAVPASLARSAVLIDRFLSYYLIVLIGAGFLVAYDRLRHVFAASGVRTSQT